RWCEQRGSRLRFSRTDLGTVENLGKWLTTVVSRVCLNMLEARRLHPEEPLDSDALAPVATHDATTDPEQEA
ncbi:MAG: RNA polymerase subunit sigma-70, partial [Chloroflexota bacterium]